MEEKIQRLKDIGVTVKCSDRIVLSSKYFCHIMYFANIYIKYEIESYIYIQESYLLFDDLFCNFNLGNYKSNDSTLSIGEFITNSSIYFAIIKLPEHNIDSYTTKQFISRDKPGNNFYIGHFSSGCPWAPT